MGDYSGMFWLGVVKHHKSFSNSVMDRQKERGQWCQMTTDMKRKNVEQREKVSARTYFTSGAKYNPKHYEVLHQFQLAHWSDKNQTHCHSTDIPFKRHLGKHVCQLKSFPIKTKASQIFKYQRDQNFVEKQTSEKHEWILNWLGVLYLCYIKVRYCTVIICFRRTDMMDGEMGSST